MYQRAAAREVAVPAEPLKRFTKRLRGHGSVGVEELFRLGCRDVVFEPLLRELVDIEVEAIFVLHRDEFFGVALIVRLYWPLRQRACCRGNFGALGGQFTRQ